MKKQKRWQFALIVVVVSLTFYNILPTILFYSKPLKAPIEESQAIAIAEQAAARVNALEDNSLDWLKSFNKLLNIKPSKISLDRASPEFIHVWFEKEEDAKKLRKQLPRAGSLIPFVPAKLSLIPNSNDKKQEDSVVTIQRRIPIHFSPDQIKKHFNLQANEMRRGISPPFTVKP